MLSTACILTVLTLQSQTVSSPRPELSVEQILESYVEDFRHDRFAATSAVFGVRIPDVGQWHVVVAGTQNDKQWKVDLQKGPSTKPTFVYQLSEETLRAIEKGKVNALTAQAKA